MAPRSAVTAILVGALALAVVVVMLSVGLTTTPKAVVVTPCSSSTVPKVTVRNSSMTRYISPDVSGADAGFDEWTLTVSLDLSLANDSLDAIPHLTLDVIPKYRSMWMDVLVGRGGFDANGTLTLTGAPPNLPGFYDHMTIYVKHKSGSCAAVTVAEFNVSIDVTCSATILNSGWCNGERRWIPAVSRCLRTYRPCGQDISLGVPETDMCKVYPCYDSNKTCGRVPLGSNCLDCTPVGPACTPNCTNADNSTRECGDDGCGTPCGSFGDGNGCDPADPAGKISCDSSVGQCVTATVGSCQLPYPLFGRTMAAGEATLNPSDMDGVQYYHLNNTSPNNTDPVVLVTSATTNNSLPNGYPADGLTVPVDGIRVRIKYNTIYYPDTVTSINNAVGTSDVTFRFTIPNTTSYQAFEAYLLDGTGDTGAYSRDMYLSVVKDDCSVFAPGDSSFSPADQYESDDASPPGGFGSYIFSTGLRNYKLVGSTYSQGNAGPSWLEVVFTSAAEGGPCPPICVGHECGSNGCGGVCNVQWCSEGLQCPHGRCSNCGPNIPKNCNQTGNVDYFEPYNDPNLTYVSECGPDSNRCGLTCGPLNGECPAGSKCSLGMGVCVQVPACDHNVPDCSDKPLPAPHKKRGRSVANPQYTSCYWNRYFCDVYCNWREMSEKLPDIIPNPQEWFSDSFLMQWKLFDDLSCAIDEQCVFGKGNRLIVRFNTDVMNIGTLHFRFKYIGENVYSRPDIVEYAHCHQHPHLKGFAQFHLGNSNNTIAVQSGKQSYCVESTSQYQVGPKVPCSSETSCGYQGLEPGMYDRYDAYLDCQWLDVTGLVEARDLNRWFIYQISVNNGRPISEYSYINNAVEFPIFLPCPPALNGYIVPTQVPFTNASVCCSRPGGPDAQFCPDAGNICSTSPAVPNQNVCNYDLHL